MKHISRQQFEDQLSFVHDSPSDDGTLEMIVIRPETNERQILHSCELSLKGGTHGDNWAQGCWNSLPDGAPHPDVQLTLMNYRVLTLISDNDKDRALAGDNLCVDLDLSNDNLKCGDCLTIGSAVIEVTDIPHNGCAKFAERFGKEALSVINSDMGKRLHLRGIYARVVVDGTVTVGDTISKLKTEQEDGPIPSESALSDGSSS